MSRLGLSLPIEGSPIADTVGPLARLAEESGYTDVWSAEVSGADAFTPLAVVAASTEKVRLGTAIVPAFTRPPALLAMTAASLQALSGGRFVLGIGTSTSIIVERWMGIPFERPLTRVRETVGAVRDALAGKKVETDGRAVSIKGFRLTADPGNEVPVYIAALGPRMLRLAGEIADGVILFLFTPDGVADALDKVREGAEAAGRDPDEIDVVARIGVAVDEDEEILRYMLRRFTVPYAMVDVYNRSLVRQGFEAEASKIARLWKEGDRESAVAAITDEMIEGFYIFGDAEACRKRIQQFRDAGLKTPVLLPISVEGDPVVRLERIRAMVPALAGA
jgi:probable F420-dependent oxidoreductase